MNRFLQQFNSFHNSEFVLFHLKYKSANEAYERGNDSILLRFALIIWLITIKDKLCPFHETVCVQFFGLIFGNISTRFLDSNGHPCGTSPSTGKPNPPPWVSATHRHHYTVKTRNKENYNSKNVAKWVWWSLYYNLMEWNFEWWLTITGSVECHKRSIAIQIHAGLIV